MSDKTVAQQAQDAAGGAAESVSNAANSATKTVGPAIAPTRNSHIGLDPSTTAAALCARMSQTARREKVFLTIELVVTIGSEPEVRLCIVEAQFW